MYIYSVAQVCQPVCWQARCRVLPIPIEVEAFPDGKIGQIIDEKHPDVILLGPQVKYRYAEIVEKYGSTGIPIQVIDQTDYGMMNGEKVLKSAIKLMKSAK